MTSAELRRRVAELPSFAAPAAASVSDPYPGEDAPFVLVHAWALRQWERLRREPSPRNYTAGEWVNLFFLVADLDEDPP